MATWTQPTTADTNANWATYLQSRADSQAKLFDDGVTWTSLPTNTIRWNSTNHRFEKWNGSSWADLDAVLSGALVKTNNLSDLSSAATARTNLGLGSIATVASPVPIANGGTASTTASAARTALGLGTIATQNSSAVSITGGTISGIAIATDFTFAASMVIRASTSAGSDNVNLSLFGGHDSNNGGGLIVYGDEDGSVPGGATLFASSGIASPVLTLLNQSASGVINIKAGGNTLRWQYDASGNFSGDATNGGDVVIAKSGKFFKCSNVQTYSPTLTGDGFAVLDTYNIVENFWERVGIWIFLRLLVNCHVVSGAPSTFTLSAPFAGVSGGALNFPCSVYFNAMGTKAPVGKWYYVNPTGILVRNYDTTAAAAGDTVTIAIDGKYRAV